MWWYQLSSAGKAAQTPARSKAWLSLLPFFLFCCFFLPLWVLFGLKAADFGTVVPPPPAGWVLAAVCAGLCCAHCGVCLLVFALRTKPIAGREEEEPAGSSTTWDTLSRSNGFCKVSSQPSADRCFCYWWNSRMCICTSQGTPKRIMGRPVRQSRDLKSPVSQKGLEEPGLFGLEDIQRKCSKLLQRGGNKLSSISVLKSAGRNGRKLQQKTRL